MDVVDRLAKERRARLAAERLLEQKSRELYAANEKLALHARALSDQIVEQRQVVKFALTETEILKGQNNRFMTDLQQAHTAAVVAERRLWDSINTIQDGFAVFNPDLKLVAANAAYLAFFPENTVAPGISYKEILQKSVESGIVQTAGLEPQDWCDWMLRRWEDDVIEPVEIGLTTGTWLRMVVQRSRDGDMVCLILDITEQMRIWSAIEAIPDGFVLFDREERLLVCNQRYRDIYPESAAAMVPGTKFETILRFGLERGQHHDEIGREEIWLAERLEQHRNPSGEAVQQLNSGRWIKALDHATPDGGRVGLRLDITEARESQAALETARTEAEAANRAKSAFLANMSHEIRTPMNGVVGMAELLCESNLSEEQRLFADTIRSSGEALLVIINDILDYSKIEAERLTLYPEPFDLERTIHEVTMLLQPKARAKGIDLMIDFDMFLPTRYIGDPGRLRQVLTNLIGNAVKFTEIGHVLVRVVGIEATPGSQQLHITVEDTGIGIPAEHLDHIFGEFNQVESEANRKFEGTGLGLAITERLIDRMGGAVWVDSEIGLGSCFGFRLSLPVAEDNIGQEHPVNLRRALVVDDKFINRTILERQLLTCGIKAAMCRSGTDALAGLTLDRDYDVILADDDMPEMDGVAFAARIREMGVAVPILLLAANPIRARDSVMAAELAGVLQKPLLRSDLYRCLHGLSGAAEPLAAAPLVGNGHRQMRVLAAEDNRTNQLVFRKMVKDLDIDLTIANNGLEAIELFQSLRPDLIFMDISMPEMDGKQAATTIRTLEGGASHVPIVALTAHAMDGDASEILASGIDHYMTKPLRKSAILDVLENFCPIDARPVVVPSEMTGT